MKKLLSILLVAMMLFAVAGVASAEGKTIVYWSMWEATEPQGQVIQEAINAYMADTGNVVDAQFKGRTGIREGLQPALDAGTVIDLFDEDIDRVNKTWGAYIMDLEALAAENDYEATAIAGLIAACRESGGGTLKSIPYQPNVFAVFYNQDIFDEVGIEAVPTTWDEFLDACQKIKDGGYIPLTSDDAYIMCNLGYHLSRLIGEEGTHNVVMDGLWAEEPAVLQAAQAYEELASKGYLSPTIGSSVWPMNQNGELALGDAAMYLNGSWLPNEVKDMTGPDFRWGCFSYPALDGGANGVEASNYGAQVFAINTKSEVAPEAFEIIEYITKGKYDQELSTASVGIPADTTNTEWPTMLASVQPVMAELTTRWTWAAGIEDNPDLTPIIKENFQKLCAGTQTAQEFVDAMEAASK